MAREYRLISRLGVWQVCSKARRLDDDGNPRLVWIYGKERIEFCDVGREDDVMVIPYVGTKNFHGDRFTHAIDCQGPHDRLPAKIGGMNDAGAAQAAFEYLVRSNPPDRVLTLRDGARIMRRENGRAVWNPLIERWLKAPDQSEAPDNGASDPRA